MNVHAIALLGAKKFRPSSGYTYLQFLFENIKYSSNDPTVRKIFNNSGFFYFLLKAYSRYKGAVTK